MFDPMLFRNKKTANKTLILYLLNPLTEFADFFKIHPYTYEYEHITLESSGYEIEIS